MYFYIHMSYLQLQFTVLIVYNSKVYTLQYILMLMYCVVPLIPSELLQCRRDYAFINKHLLPSRYRLHVSDITGLLILSYDDLSRCSFNSKVSCSHKKNPHWLSTFSTIRSLSFIENNGVSSRLT